MTLLNSTNPRIAAAQARTIDTLMAIPDEYGAAFANKADAGIVIYRDKGDESKPVEVHVQKIRYHEIGGLTGNDPVLLRHDKTTGRYWETVSW